MALVIGYGSIIQYHHDIARREGANVGIVLFVPEPHFIGVRISPDNECPKQRFGNEAIEDLFVDSAKRAIKSRLMEEGKSWRSRDNLEHFRRCEGNSMQMTEPFNQLVDPLELESELEALYRQLVYVAPRGPTGKIDF